MSFQRAKEHLVGCGLDKHIMEFKVSSATVKQAAEAIGCKEGNIAKSMSFIVNGSPILVITSGDQKIDNSKFKTQFETKAKMIPFEEVNSLIGHEVGGVCPFGINKGVKVYLDKSLKNYETVYPACGSDNSAVKLTIEELEYSSNYESWIDVCKNIFN